MNEIEKVAAILEGVGRDNRDRQEFMGEGDDGLTVISAALLEMCVEKLRGETNPPERLVSPRTEVRSEEVARRVVVQEMQSAMLVVENDGSRYWDIYTGASSHLSAPFGEPFVLDPTDFPDGTIVKVYETQGG